MSMSEDQQTLTIRVPFEMRKRGGRKQIISPDGTAPNLATPKTNTAVIKAIARAFRWRDLLESGAYQTIDELAKAEEINPSYLSRTLRLTLLAPDTVEAALNGRAVGPDLKQLMPNVPVLWSKRTCDL